MSLKIIQGGAKPNRHPVDELADIREEAKRLKEREDVLRKEILAGGCGLVGYDFEASVTEAESERVDTKALREKLGDGILPFLKTSKTRIIRVARRQPDDAA